MHNNSMKLMTYFRDKYLSEMKRATILDVGSMLQLGAGKQKTYKELFEKDFNYIGMDIEPGSNVDIVGYHSIIEKYDVVISGQVMEHVNRPWEWLKNLTNFFNKYICIIVPNTWDEHRFPIDTYRYFPDGMKDLFEYAGIKELEIFRDYCDTIGIGTHND